MMEPESNEESPPGLPWLPRYWELECPVQQHLMEAAMCLRETGRYEEASRNFAEAYQKHLQDLNRPPLSFSGTFPLFFASLRSDKDVPTLIDSGRAQLVPCEDHISDAFACCRSLLESLSCSFGKEPPEEVPEGCSKQQFVHELCAQAGIYLDMVRLGHIFRKKRRVLKATKSNLTDSLSNAPSTPASSQLDATPFTPAGKDECRTLMEYGFVRAGSILRAVQAEIDSLHEEALRAAADLKQGNTKEGQELLIGLAQDGTIDPQLLHTFGDFLDLHLLPLYVRDMPLESLRETLLHYCGISLDEEDEIKARQVLGCPPRQKSRKKLGKNISDTSMPGTPSSQGSAMELSLRQILQASGQERKLRDQMLNSVVEKRRFGLSAHPDLKIPRDVASPALAHKRKAAGPCTPDKKNQEGPAFGDLNDSSAHISGLHCVARWVTRTWTSTWNRREVEPA